MSVNPDDFYSLPELDNPLRREFLDHLHQLRDNIKSNPLANPIELLALEISERIGRKELDLPALLQLSRQLVGRAFFTRAKRLNDYVGETSTEVNQATLREALQKRALHNDAPIPFLEFKSFLERELAGIVITAHPTFGISAELNQHLALLTSGVNPDGAPLSSDDLVSLQARITSLSHRPSNELTLLFEQELSLAAIENIQHAVRLIYREALEVAQTLYPDRWMEITPRLLTTATWVGYDLDGRSDIGWNDTFLTRQKVALKQTEYYHAKLAEIIERLAPEATALPPLCAERDRLAFTIKENQRTLALLPEANQSPEAAAQLGKQLVDSKAERLVRITSLLDALTGALHSEEDPDFLREVFILRSEVANYGLAMAQTHVRINSNQLHNAINHHLEATGDPDTPGNRSLYMKQITELLSTVSPVTVNFGSILTEGTSAKRMFMVVAQLLKHVDSEIPVRFLIAECDSPFTVLTALYFARLFGIEDKLDISPLFETNTALQRGEALIEKLLENPHYVDYVTRRGRLCIQTGFSDAGRYLGQIAAGMAIERLRMKLSRLLEKANLGAIQLVIFDTHGESIGRGAHPVSFQQRLDYVSPPASLALFLRNGIDFKQELSFQGGDGYVYFLTKELAFATVSRIMEKVLATPLLEEEDSFYVNTDHSLDFFITIKEFNERTMDHPNYASLLGTFGPNMLYPTGSRMVKRQHETVSRAQTDHPSQIRAIPHNAILQQLGFWANSVGGLGHAIARDDERFVQLYQTSARCRCCVSMAAYAQQLSSLDVLGSYLSLFNPDYWFQRLKLESNPARKQEMRLVGDFLDRSSNYEKLRRIFRRFRKDELDLKAGLKLLPEASELPDYTEHFKEDLNLFHSLRVALISELFLMAMKVPRFTNQASITMETIIERLLQLDVEPALEVLRRAFPEDGKPLNDAMFGEPATYRCDTDRGYAKEHDELFGPMGELYDLIRELSLGISHIVGAVG